MTADESEGRRDPEEQKPEAEEPEGEQKPAEPVDLVTRRKPVFIGCSVVCAVTAGFLVDDVVRSSDQYGTGAWLGVVFSAVAILGLSGVYLLCGLDRLELDRKLAGQFTVFHLTAVLLVFGIGADVLVPARDAGGLALLLPWGITYWLHSLTQQKKNAEQD